MTFILKCDTCGKEQEASPSETGYPVNPINPDTGSQWYSRTENGKTIHACRREHIPEGAMVWPEWAKF